MRWRRAFAALSAVLLLAASWGATACDLACSIQMLRPTCHDAPGSSGAPTVSMQLYHGHCAHMRDGMEHPVSSIDLVSDSGCHHSICRLAGIESVPAKVFQFDQLN